MSKVFWCKTFLCLQRFVNMDDKKNFPIVSMGEKLQLGHSPDQNEQMHYKQGFLAGWLKVSQEHFLVWSLFVFHTISISKRTSLIWRFQNIKKLKWKKKWKVFVLKEESVWWTERKVIPKTNVYRPPHGHIFCKQFEKLVLNHQYSDQTQGT